ncbi:MAG TPA: nitronate monooxygenase [Nannocystaceae bacterium]|nr:nitronate monooxygenase [Nannocystaceae bacterium]
MTSEVMTRLGLRAPIVQGPFGGGLSTVELAATVAELGGLGSFGAYTFTPAAIEDIARQIKARTDRPFALNLWVSNSDEGGSTPDPALLDALREELAPWLAELGLDVPDPPARFHESFDAQVDAVLAAEPAVFSFVFGIPSPKILAACRARGIVTAGAATNIAEARALDEAGVDLIVATGCEAGGHRPSFLARAEDSLVGTFVLTQLVAPRVRAPVIAAGGIVDRRGLAAARTLGADAVQIGTAFLACAESGASPEHRALLFDEARTQQTVLTRAFSGRLARGLRNRWTDAHIDRALAPFPVQSWLTGVLKRAAIAQHRTDVISLWSSQAAPNLRHRTAAELWAALTQEE